MCHTGSVKPTVLQSCWSWGFKHAIFMFTAKNSTGSSPSLVPLGFSFSSKCARVRREMESVHVQLQLYIFISEPQLSFNWYGRKKMVDSWTVRWMRQSTCTGLMPRVCLKVHISEKHRCSRSKFNTTVHALDE